ncbi:hypothetical protein [Fuerstiella marisgermanici]|uniref:Uncharacterized protein n=1 Tax=Fuerstiella marisgermanici TaxID=1891926 RepID=A0A1P8WAC5_9PLAN|nr:hypothetical protein [Fuerstiella marisgermanici]APZ90995.1 hypothetical protein Fuma_00579 [Fuerstiella marisgermanici]
MKLSIAAALLCLASVSNVSAAEIRWNGQVYETQTVTPVTVDAYGRIMPGQPITVLIPVRQENRSSVMSTPRMETDVALPHKSIPGVRFADLKRPDSKTSNVSDGREITGRAPSRTYTAPNQESQLTDMRSTDRRPTVLDSRLDARRVY